MYYYYAVLSFLLHKLPASRPFQNSLQFIRCFNFLPSFMYTLYMDKLRIFPAHHFKITVVDKSYFFFFQVCCATVTEFWNKFYVPEMAIQQNTHARKRRSDKPRQTSFVGATNLITYFNFVGFVNKKKKKTPLICGGNQFINSVYYIKKCSFSEKKKRNFITKCYLWMHFLNK